MRNRLRVSHMLPSTKKGFWGEAGTEMTNESLPCTGRIYVMIYTEVDIQETQTDSTGACVPFYHNWLKHQYSKARNRPMKMAWTGCNMDGQRREGILQIKQKINLQTIQRKSGWGVEQLQQTQKQKRVQWEDPLINQHKQKYQTPHNHKHIQKHDIRNEDSVQGINNTQERKNWLFTFN